MTERNEQGFVKDINVAIEEINKNISSSAEKIRTLIDLPFSIEDVMKVNEFINQETKEMVDCNDELYNIAILNEQILEFDETLKSQLEKRHDELVEALMNRMEGVFKMYNNEDLNVQPVYPEVEQPVDVQTPQVEEYNPVAPQVEDVAVPVDGYVAPPEVAEESVVPVVDAPAEIPEMPEMVVPAEFTEPVASAYEEPVMETTAVEVPEELTAPVDGYVAPEVTGETTIDVPTFEAPVETYDVPTFEVPVEEPAMEAAGVDVPEELAAPVDGYVAPEVTSEATVDVPTFEAPVETYDVPTFEVPVEEPVAETYEEPAMENVVEEYATPEMEAPVEETTEEDDVVKEIEDRYKKLMALEIRVHNNEKKLAELHSQVETVQQDIYNDQEEIAELKKTK